MKRINLGIALLLAAGAAAAQNVDHASFDALLRANVRNSAIVCASKSCPLLRAEAYASDRVDSQLDDQARLFVNDPFRNRFDVNSKTAQLSEIFNWFDEDCTSAGSTQRFMARYATDPAVARALAADQFKVAWIDYDWNLNGTPPAR